MINDPLQRRMFAQQVMAQHARANQPMGILASSPQLMNSVQGFANGGEVKGYEKGGIENAREVADNINNRGFSILSVPIILKQNPNITFNKDAQRFIPKTDKNDLPAESNTTSTLNLEDLKNKSLIKTEGEFGNTAPVVKKTNEANTFSVGANPNLEGVDGYGTKINEVNNELNNKNNKNNKIEQSDKELKDAIPEGKNLGFETSEPQNPYENLDKKYATKLKKANALFDTATNDPKVTNEWKQKVEDIYSKEGKIDLEKIDKLAKEGAGIGDDNYDKRRSTAFWMGLIKGGLATAGGESSNALTNIAKGLGFGVESYGKDINAINEDEREDRKEYGKLKVDLIKSEESKLLAHKSLELQYASKMYEVKQNQNNFESKMDFQKAQAKINNEMQFETIEISKAKAWNDIQWKDKTYDLQLKEFALNKEKQADYVKLTTRQLKNAWDKSLITDDMKEVIAMGSEYINVNQDTGRFESFTDLGKKALVASKLTGHKVTDLNTVSNGYVALGSVLGVKFLKEDGAVDTTKTKAAGLVWQESFADKWQKIQIKKGSGTLDIKGQKLEEQRVLEDFAKKTGGIYTAPNSTSPSGTSVIQSITKKQ